MDGLHDVSKVCRLCLQANNEMMCPIFPSSRQSNGIPSLSYRIMACARIKLTEGDGLPPNVCTSCLAQVDRSYQFKLLCEKTDLTLRGEIKVDYASSTETESLDGAESCWDMTKFTPEVIIKEDADEGILVENGPVSPGCQLDPYFAEDLTNQVHGALYPLQRVEDLLKNHGTEIKVQPEPDDSGATALLVAHRLVPLMRNHRPGSGIIGAGGTTATAVLLAAATAPVIPAVPQCPQLPEVAASQQQTTVDDGRTRMGRRQSDESIQAALNAKSRRCRGGDKLFKCSQCNKSYSFSSALSRHKAVHNKELRPHICKICNKGFTHPDKLLRHQKTHSLDMFMSCDVCSRPFKSYPAYQKHKQNGNCDSGNCTNFCQLCNVEYDSYKTHVCQTRTNNDDRNPKRADYVSCNGKRDNEQQQQQLLDRSPEEDVKKTPPSSPASSPSPNSRRTRTKSDFKCKVCQKYFATKGSLEVHSSIHTGVRPFVCSACGKSFRHKVNLMEHFQRKHSQVRPYICDVCAARFVTKQELVRHYRKHIGD